MFKYFLANFFSEQFGHVGVLVATRHHSVADVLSQAWHTLSQNYEHVDVTAYEAISEKLDEVHGNESALKLMEITLDPRLYRSRIGFRSVEEISEDKYKELDAIAMSENNNGAYCV